MTEERKRARIVVVRLLACPATGHTLVSDMEVVESYVAVCLLEQAAELEQLREFAVKVRKASSHADRSTLARGKLPVAIRDAIRVLDESMVPSPS
jgi:hypothetical protein